MGSREQMAKSSFLCRIFLHKLLCNESCESRTEITDLIIIIKNPFVLLKTSSWPKTSPSMTNVEFGLHKS